MCPHLRMRSIPLFIFDCSSSTSVCPLAFASGSPTGAPSHVSCSLQYSILIIARPDKFIMSISTPFHERTFALCESLNYREWSGYYTVSAYETHHDHEYNE